jgi:hypothetical protein
MTTTELWLLAYYGTGFLLGIVVGMVAVLTGGGSRRIQ